MQLETYKEKPTAEPDPRERRRRFDRRWGRTRQSDQSPPSPSAPALPFLSDLTGSLNTLPGSLSRDQTRACVRGSDEKGRPRGTDLTSRKAFKGDFASLLPLSRHLREWRVAAPWGRRPPGAAPAAMAHGGTTGADCVLKKLSSVLLGPDVASAPQAHRTSARPRPSPTPRWLRRTPVSAPPCLARPCPRWSRSPAPCWRTPRMWRAPVPARRSSPPAWPSSLVRSPAGAGGGGAVPGGQHPGRQQAGLDILV